MPSDYDDEPDYDAHCYACECGLWDGDYEYIDDEPHCNDCYALKENTIVIHNWGYKPEPSFLNDDGRATSMYQPMGSQVYKDARGRNVLRSQLYMGFEQEVEHLGYDREEVAQVVLDVANANKQVVYIKDDASLDSGFEIVSHPGTLEFFTKHFDWSAISQLSDLNCKSWNRKTCGLHIHMSRSAFKDEKHLFKFLVLIYKNATSMIQFAGRNSHFAKFDIDAFLNGYDGWGDKAVRNTSFMKMAKRESSNDDRYCAVNLRNSQTIELRFFRPSLLPSTTLAALQLCDAMFHYTEAMTTPEVMSKKALEFAQFAKWVEQQNNKYKILDNRIKTRVTIGEK